MFSSLMSHHVSGTLAFLWLLHKVLLLRCAVVALRCYLQHPRNVEASFDCTQAFLSLFSTVEWTFLN